MVLNHKLIFKLLIFVCCFSVPSISEATLAPQVVNHIQDRHWYNAKQGPATSHFKQSMTIEKLDKLAMQTIKKGSVRPSKNGQGRKTYQYTHKHTLGSDSNGRPTKTLRVVTDVNNNVITAFPV